MIKVIKEGKADPTQTKTCFKCKTKFSFQNEDIKTDSDGSYVPCPNVKCTAFIAASPKTP